MIAVFQFHLRGSRNIFRAGKFACLFVLALLNHRCRQERAGRLHRTDAISDIFECGLECCGRNLRGISASLAMWPDSRISYDKDAAFREQPQCLVETAAEVWTIEVHQGQRTHDTIVAAGGKAEITKAGEIGTEKPPVSAGEEFPVQCECAI